MVAAMGRGIIPGRVECRLPLEWLGNLCLQALYEQGNGMLIQKRLDGICSDEKYLNCTYWLEHFELGVNGVDGLTGETKALEDLRGSCLEDGMSIVPVHKSF